MPTTYPYSCSGEHSTVQFEPFLYNNSIQAGMLFSVEGRVKSDMKVTNIDLDIRDANGSLVVHGNDSIAKGAANTWVSFYIRVTVPSSETHEQPVFFKFWVGHTGYSETVDATTPSFNYCGFLVDPRIASLKFTRCDGSGNAADDGVYLRCDELQIAVSSGRTISDITSLTWKNGKLGATKSCSIPSSTSYSDSGAPSSSWLLGDTTFSASSQHELIFTISAGSETSSYSTVVDIAKAKLHISGKEVGGVAIGQFSTSTNSRPKFEVARSHYSYFYNGIEGISNYQAGYYNQICGVFHGPDRDYNIHRYVGGFEYGDKIPDFDKVYQIHRLQATACMQNGNWKSIDVRVLADGTIDLDLTNVEDYIVLVDYILSNGE